MAVSLVPPGPALPPALAAVLQSFAEAIGELQQPGAPLAMPIHPTASTLEDVAPAARHPNRAIAVSDINSIVLSTQVAGIWTWRRADGSAL